MVGSLQTKVFVCLDQQLFVVGRHYGDDEFVVVDDDQESVPVHVSEEAIVQRNATQVAYLLVPQMGRVQTTRVQRMWQREKL